MTTICLSPETSSACESHKGLIVFTQNAVNATCSLCCWGGLELCRAGSRSWCDQGTCLVLQQSGITELAAIAAGWLHAHSRVEQSRHSKWSSCIIASVSLIICPTHGGAKSGETGLTMHNANISCGRGCCGCMHKSLKTCWALASPTQCSVVQGKGVCTQHHTYGMRQVEHSD